jgi:hypothetical protein
MKTYFLFFLLAFPAAAIAQKQQSKVPPAAVLLDGTALPYDTDTQLITYQGVVESTGVTQAQLYARAQDWLAKTANTTSNTPPQSTATDQLVAKGSWPSTISLMGGTVAAGTIQYTLSIYFKDGRYKYVLTNLTHTSTGGVQDIAAVGPLEQVDVQIIAMVGSKRPWDRMRRQADVNAQKLVADLQNAMKGTKDPKDF